MTEGGVQGEQERGGMESRKERIKRVAGGKDEEGRESTHLSNFESDKVAAVMSRTRLYSILK